MEYVDFVPEEVKKVLNPAAWKFVFSSLVHGRTVDILASAFTKSCVLAVNLSIEEINHFIEKGGAYVASIKLTAQHEFLSPSEMRVYVIYNIIESIENGNAIIDSTAISSKRMV